MPTQKASGPRQRGIDRPHDKVAALKSPAGGKSQGGGPPYGAAKGAAQRVDRSSRQVDETDRLIARALRDARERKGLTQLEFAARLGVSYQQLQKYERGLNRVSGSVLMRSAKLLDVPVAALFADADAAAAWAAPETHGLVATPRVPVAGPRLETHAAGPATGGELAEFADICERILRLQSPRLRRALLAVAQQSVDEDVA